MPAVELDVFVVGQIAEKAVGGAGRIGLHSLKRFSKRREAVFPSRGTGNEAASGVLWQLEARRHSLAQNPFLEEFSQHPHEKWRSGREAVNGVGHRKRQVLQDLARSPIPQIADA